MGLIHVTVTVRGFGEPAASYEADFLVDTGATDSMAPSGELRRIGVAPVGRMTYELADGSAHEYEFGLARIEFLGEVTAGRVLFGPDGVEPRLGVTALESIGITIDPVTQTLKRLPAIPLKPVAATAGPVR
jgi:clan AA aspartic protease